MSDNKPGYGYGNGYAQAVAAAVTATEATGIRHAVRGRYSPTLKQWVYGIWSPGTYPTTRDPRKARSREGAQA